MNHLSRNLIKAGRFVPASPALVGSGMAAAGEDSKPHAAADEKPVVSLHRKDNLIEAIEVSCCCGRTTILECQYEEETTP